MKQSTLKSLMIPLQDRKLLLPQGVIAKVEPMARLIVETQGERWILGHKHWAKMRIPVISFEILAGGRLKKHSEHARIAIFKGSGKHTALPYWGMLVQGAPDNFALKESEIKIINENLSDAEYLSVQFHKDNARIPNLDFIEDQLMASGVVH